ncbi:MAG: metallopeptidase family protein [Chloroflexi bacterium]|nr:metallopeptidase family protein [Chloroflexota bacterium]
MRSARKRADVVAVHGALAVRHRHAMELLGYQGVPRTAWGAGSAMVASKITIFRGPLRRAHPTATGLAAAVEDVIRHEIAHHLGIDDNRLIQLRQHR